MADAQKKPAEGTPEWYEEMVSYRAFKDNDKYKDDIFVAVNGKGFQIQRGVEVEIPRYVYLVLEQGRDQDTKTANLIAEREEDFKRESKVRGI